MENLYIQIQNGQPINHPATESNLISAFGSIPSDWEAFVRVPKGMNPPYTWVSNTSTYQKVNGVWQDVWETTPFTDEEKTQAIANMQKLPPGPNVILDTIKFEWIPAIPKPNDGNKYIWDYLTGAWVEVPTT